jgi:hypothetical protein
MAVSKELLEILACPKCKGGVRYDKRSILCDKCRLRFKVIDGTIPDMLLKDAEKF